MSTASNPQLILPFPTEPMAPSTLSARSSEPKRALAAETALAGALALAVRLPGLTHEPWGDELYHILSARQYLETGVLGISGGIYNRDAIYSEMAAALYRIFGESPVVARLPALVAGVLTVMLLFLWIRRSGDRTAAWVAAALLALTPALIEQAQYARAYPLQHLFVLLSAVALSQLLELRRPTVRKSLAFAAVAALSLMVALSFQMLSLIAGAGLALGAALLAGPDIARRIPPSRRVVTATALVVLIALAGLAAYRSGMVDRFVSLAMYSDMWAERNQNEIRFYHWILLEDFPTAWTLFPVVVLMAVIRRPTPAILSASVFVIAFTTQSLLAWKAERYFSYALPFFAVLVGLAVAQVVPLVKSLLWRAAPGRSARLLRWAAASAIVGFLLLSNHAFVQSARQITRDHSFLYPGGSTPTLSWSLATPLLAPIAAEADAVVSTEDLEAIYFLDRLDYVLDRDHLRQGVQRPEFAIDPRINTPMIGETTSLQRVVACHPTGLLVAMRWALESYKMAPETAAFITENLQPVPLPSATGLVAYRWHDRVSEQAQGCDDPLGSNGET